MSPPARPSIRRSITEPSHGPVKVTLGGRPSGASRTVKMVLEDTSPTFFNQYDFASFEPIVWVNPVNRVQVEVYIGGTWSINGGGDPVLTGGHWETGPTITAPDTALSLPSGVTRRPGAGRAVHLHQVRRFQLGEPGRTPRRPRAST